MGGQLPSALGLVSSGMGAAVAGVPWVAVAAIVAAVPYLAIGLLLTFGGNRGRRDRLAH